MRGREVGVRSLGPQDAVGTRSSNTSERSLLAFYEGPRNSKPLKLGGIYSI